MDDYQDNETQNRKPTKGVIGAALLAGTVCTGLLFSGIKSFKEVDRFLEHRQEVRALQDEAEAMNPQGEYAGILAMIKTFNDLTVMVQNNLQTGSKTTVQQMGQSGQNSFSQMIGEPIQDLEQMSNEELLAALQSINTKLDGILLQQLSNNNRQTDTVREMYRSMHLLKFNQDEIKNVESGVSKVINKVTETEMSR